MTLPQAYQIFQLDFGSSFQLAEAAYFEYLLRLQSGENITDLYGNPITRKDIDTAFYLIKEHHQRKTEAHSSTSQTTLPKPPSAILSQWNDATGAGQDPQLILPKPNKPTYQEPVPFFYNPNESPKMQVRTSIELKSNKAERESLAGGQKESQESVENEFSSNALFPDEHQEENAEPSPGELRTTVHFKPEKNKRTLRVPFSQESERDSDRFPPEPQVPFFNVRTTAKVAQNQTEESKIKDKPPKQEMKRSRLISSAHKKGLSSTKQYSDDQSTLLFSSDSDREKQHVQTNNQTVQVSPEEIQPKQQPNSSQFANEANTEQSAFQSTNSKNSEYMDISGHWHDYTPELTETELIDVQFAYQRSIGKKERERKLLLFGLVAIYLALIVGILAIRMLM
ncbi:MAG: hypothetical protein N2450_02015 [bacterium]|nr:hypothetical protein [bacterium]